MSQYRVSMLMVIMVAFISISTLFAEEKKWTADSAWNIPGNRLYKTVDGIEYGFRWCPVGEFTVGSPEDEKGRNLNEGPQYQALVEKGFWMLETEVTQEMWKKVVGKNPSLFKADFAPVESVSWSDCLKFCEKLSKKLDVPIQLPTEEEWEYACRAGTTTPYAGNIDEMAWYRGNAKKMTQPVAKMQPNAWGLYDMHGNVAEWCAGWAGDYPPASEPESTTQCAIRGGNWRSVASECRSASRHKNEIDYKYDNVGFRVLFFPTSTMKISKKSSKSMADKTKTLSENNKKENTWIPVSPMRVGQRIQKKIGKIKYNFHWCPPGEFYMGRNEDELHLVRLTKGFWMLETEVTQEMWESLMDYNKSKIKGANYPIENISWLACNEYCEKLSAQLGVKVTLPTEAQWEYACKTKGKAPTAKKLELMTWHNKNCKSYQPVGKKKPNAWGLFDMMGNVKEWCWDAYEPYPTTPVSDPTGAEKGKNRIVRGGAYYESIKYCTPTIRSHHYEQFERKNVGFRVVILPEESTN